MAKTLAELRTDARSLLSEATASYWTDAEINGHLQDGMDQFCARTLILEDISTYSLIQYVSDYVLPSAYAGIKYGEIIKGNSVYQLTPETLYEHFTGNVKQTSTPPTFVNIWGEKLRLRERPSESAQTTTLSGAISTGTVNISIASAAGMPRMGRIIIGSEVIQYWNLSGTMLSTCDRGMEGTTASNHLTAAVTTLRDMWVYYGKKETLVESTDNSLPSQFDPAISYYAASMGRRKSKDHDLAKFYMDEFERFVAMGQEYAKFRWKRGYKPQ